MICNHFIVSFSQKLNDNCVKLPSTKGLLFIFKGFDFWVKLITIVSAWIRIYNFKQIDFKGLRAEKTQVFHLVPYSMLLHRTLDSLSWPKLWDKATTFLIVNELPGFLIIWNENSIGSCCHDEKRVLCDEFRQLKKNTIT